MRGSRWFDVFAAIALVGGGAPGGSSCFARAGGSCAPVFYLMGDRNPLFSLAESTRVYFEECGHAVTWDLQPGANHAREWQAYVTSRDEIAAWLLKRTNGCRAPAPEDAPPPPLPASLFAPPTSSAAPTTAPSEHPPPAGHCACATEPESPSGPWTSFLLILLAAGRRAARREPRSRCQGAL